MATTIEQVFEDIKALPPVKMQKVFEFVASIKEAENQPQITKPKVRTESSLKSKTSKFDETLDKLPENLSPHIMSLLGCIKLPPEEAETLSAKAERHKHLEEKYLND